MKPSLFLTVFTGSLLLAAHANALTLTNNESQPQDVTVITGDQEKALSISPGEALNDLCSTSCVLRLPDGSEYELEPQDQVALEDGTIYVVPEAQGSGETEQELTDKKI